MKVSAEQLNNAEDILSDIEEVNRTLKNLKDELVSKSIKEYISDLIQGLDYDLSEEKSEAEKILEQGYREEKEYMEREYWNSRFAPWEV